MDHLYIIVHTVFFNNNNNKNLVSCHKMQMQTQQHTVLGNCETRKETNVSSAYS